MSLIDKGLDLRIGGQATHGAQLRSGSDDDTDIRESLADSSQNDAAVVSVGSDPSAGVPLGVSNIRNALRITEQGISAIEELRVQQGEIAEKISSIAYGAESIELAELSQDLQTEIESIASRASANGIQVLTESALYEYSSRSYSDDGTQISRHGVIAVGDPSALSAQLGTSPILVSSSGSAVGYASQETAAEDKERIDQSLESLRAVKADLLGAQAQAENLGTPPVVVDTTDPPTDPTEAKRSVSQQIALKFGGQFAKEEAQSQLIDLIAEGVGPPLKTLGQA